MNIHKKKWERISVANIEQTVKHPGVLGGTARSTKH